MSARDRSMSPTVALWEGRQSKERCMMQMNAFGLHVMDSEWQSTGGGNTTTGRQFSTGFCVCHMKIYGTEETLDFVVQTCTKVSDVREALAAHLMVGDPYKLSFIMRNGYGGGYRKQGETEEISKNVTVRGIDSFSPQKMKWPHGTVVIGAGYNGIKTACHYAKENDWSFTVFDRYDRVGGFCWITHANKHSKLQTEFGAFHAWWGPDYYESGKCGGYPTTDNWSTWPQKDEVLKGFQYCAEEFGVLPQMQFKMDVKQIDVVGERNSESRHYKLSVKPMEDDDEKTYTASIIYTYPGSMTKNRPMEYPGEDIFEGKCGYGMNDDIPYDLLPNNRVAILGNGAFSIENVRTCCQYKSKKIFLVTRRKNLPSPRVPCWFVHQGPAPTPGSLVLKMFEPMYKLCGLGDPWEYWSVHASSDRKKVTIIQSSRFGIGDVTFIAHAYGKLVYVVDTLKRLSSDTLHLTSGNKIEDVQAVIKALGLIGDFAIDRMHRIKEMVGNWCAGDYRRPLNMDAVGMNAANFTTFSTGIGGHGFLAFHKHIHDHPIEASRMLEMGVLDTLPRHKAEEEYLKPAYLFDVRHALTSGFITEGMVPRVGMKNATVGDYKYRMMHAVNPIREYLATAKAEWDKYQETWRAEGATHEHMEYPYNYEYVADIFKQYSEHHGFWCSPDGPEGSAPPMPNPNLRFMVQMNDREYHENEIAHVKGVIQTAHHQWWANRKNSGASSIPQKNYAAGSMLGN